MLLRGEPGFTLSSWRLLKPRLTRPSTDSPPPSQSNVWEPWTWNLHQYCRNSPQNYIDPTGHVVEAHGYTVMICVGLGFRWDGGRAADDHGNAAQYCPLGVVTRYGVNVGYTFTRLWIDNVRDMQGGESAGRSRCCSLLENNS